MINGITARLLQQYPLLTPQAALHSETHHRVYRVTSGAAVYALRVQPAATLPRIQNEVRMLGVLSGRDQPVPAVVSTHDGRPWSAYGDWIGLLTYWRDGQPLTLQTVDERIIGSIGWTLGQFHADRPPYRPTQTEAAALFGDEGFYPLTALYSRLTEPQRKQVTAVWQELFPVLDTADHALLHGDFVLHNLLWHGSGCHMVDLEYSRAGDARYDVGTLLWQTRPHASWQALQHAFLSMYARSARLPDASLEPWLAARQLASLHWVAHNPHRMPQAAVVVQQRLNELSGFVRSGFLRRQP